MKIIRVASSNHFSRPSLHIPLLFLLLIDINSLKMATVVIIYIDDIHVSGSIIRYKRHTPFSTWEHSAEGAEAKFSHVMLQLLPSASLKIWTGHWWYR